MKRFLLIGLIIILATISCGKNETIRENVKLKAEDYLGLGIADYKKGDFTSSRTFMEEALKSAYSLDNTERVIDILHALGDLCIRQEDFEAASNYIYQAKYLSDSESISNYYFYIYLGIGKLYDKTSKDKAITELALIHFNKSLSFVKVDREKAIAYNSIGIALTKIEKYEEALSNLNIALGINNWIKDYDNLGDNYYNIGEVYFRQKKYLESLSNHMLSLSNDKIAENQGGILDNLQRIADIYTLQKNKSRALDYLNRALRLATAIENEAKQKKIADEIKKLGE